MADWVEQYSMALSIRDAHEQAHKPYIDAYTRLADRAATERATAATASAATSIAAAAHDTPASPLFRPNTTAAERASTPTKGHRNKEPERPQSPSTLLSTLRADLTATQKVRSALQAEVASLNTSLQELKKTSEYNLAQVVLLTKQKAEVERKLRDRDEELRGKARLVEQTQDEMVSLSLQVNMAEQKSEKLEMENKELVARWMKRMGEEAERVNEGSGWH